MKTWLLIDVSSLCYRAFHSTGQLSHKSRPTGTLFGFFRELLHLEDAFGPSSVVFCFDGKASKRREIFPDYKKGRLKHQSEFVAQDFKDFRTQVTRLRDKYLPGLKYRNIFLEEGYEADDLIARVVRTKPEGVSAVIASGDHDLYQLLDAPETVIYQPVKKKVYTAENLKADFGITPDLWPWVKAIAGCASDSIPGVPKVGEKTAARSLLGTLAEKSVAHTNILASKGLIERNIKLTLLPMDGLDTSYEIRDDWVSPRKLHSLFEHLGFKSLLPGFTKG